ncbi:ABC transporter permease [soil metagenome]
MDFLLQDLRYSVRALSRRPGFAALAILTLAVGIGVNTVAFNAVNAPILKPFRLDHADRVGWIRFEGGGAAYGQATVDEFEALGRSTTTFDSIAAEGRLPVSLQTVAGARQAWSAAVSANYLNTVEARPEMGRVFTPVDLSGSDLPVVVSHRFWQETLGSPSSVAELTLVINGRNFSVVGVLPDDFQGRGGLFAPELWLPLERTHVLNVPATLRRGGDDWLLLFGHLRPGVSREQAAAELSTISHGLTPAAPRDSAGDTLRHARFYPLNEGHPEVRGLARFAWLAMGVVGLVLLIACFNVAALMMARASERQREISVRSALGASRARILRQLVTEGTVLALISGVATLVLASWSGSLLSTFSLPAPIPQRLRLGIDRTLVMFTMLLVVVAGVLPALLPALQATRANLLRSLKAESPTGGRPSRTRNAFVILQIAGSTLFLAVALLFVRSFLNSAAFNPGFDTSHTAVMQLEPSMYGYDAERARLMIETLQSRIRSINGVTHAAVADRVPFYVGSARTIEYSADARDCAVAECRRATVYAVSPGHFEALGVPLRRGRDFAATDLSAASAVVVSETMAAQLWPGEEAIGRTLRLEPEGTSAEIIGVAADLKHRNMSEPAGAFLYRPLRRAEWTQSVTLVVRVEGDPALLLGALQDQVRSVDRDLPVTMATMTERMKLPLWPARTAAGFFLICGILALVLATVGLFGVLYFTVQQRTREFGIRIALGATARRVITVVLREGLTLAVAGVFIGSVGAFAGARLVSRAFFGISAGDPFSYSTTALVQLAVAVAACALPAYRATRADPIASLRAE